MPIRELPRTEWPPQLSEIPGPPERLWIRGALPPAGTKFLTVVGSRALSRYGEDACRHLIAGLAGYPISVVSGLALGADACAHKAALAAGLHTIAFPGSGLDDSVIGPRANLGLARDILEHGGALISEHEPMHVPNKSDFPSRNRLMVGMADAVLVIEAGPQSGTLITARLAADYNRELLCVPHRLNDPHGFGPHLFIRLGAALSSEPLHIIEALALEPRQSSERTESPSDLGDAERVIWDMLASPLSRDDILRAAPLPAGEALTALMSLELRGLVTEEFGCFNRS
ncbi:MAG TPA: DNA-processing protein DprA [Candidatus Paceibacterota bacterium]|nr:DNA-processing protein DprA [Candidatus Paceibacterota bacterium]